MAVRYNILLSCIFLSTFSNVFAEATPEEDKYKAQIMYAVQKEFRAAVAEIGEATEKCLDKEKEASNLTPLLFNKINIPQEELVSAVFYLGLKARTDCVTEIKYKNFSYYLSKFQSVLKHYNHPNYQEKGFLGITHSNAVFKELLKIKYHEIDPKNRTRLENIPELSKPFNFSKLIDQIQSTK
ncbi:MAG: hypothetical protein L3J00_06420 [Thiomicrorhabdus sp.]|nr:hypothetical protein [Thiomicrorhabdus sp.]